MKDKVARNTIERADLQASDPVKRRDSAGQDAALRDFPTSTEIAGQSGRLGELLRERGVLDDKQIKAVLAHQERYRVPFGVAAQQLGYLRDDAVKEVVASQFGYPLILPGDQSLSPELVAAYNTDSAYAESMRRLRSDLLADLPRSQTLSLVVVSPSRRDGRSHLVGNLAIVFAQLGKRVLVIDADLRRPRMQHLFRLSNDVGISLLLSGRQCADPVRVVPHFPGLNVLTAGPLPPNPQELVSGDRMHALVSSAKPRYDLILIDTPPAGPYADAENLAQIAGSAIIVAQRNKTKMLQLVPLARRLKKKDVTVAGTVLVA